MKPGIASWLPLSYVQNVLPVPSSPSGDHSPHSHDGSSMFGSMVMPDSESSVREERLSQLRGYEGGGGGRGGGGAVGDGEGDGSDGDGGGEEGLGGLGGMLGGGKDGGSGHSGLAMLE